MTTTLTAERTTGRSLISPELFDRLTHRIVTDDKLDQRLAERVLDQALAFLATCAPNTNGRLVPSRLVDIGWHTFLLHTRDYAAFCDQVAGRFLHHVPTEPEDPTAHGEPARAALARTVTAIEENGFVIDPDLWPRSAGADCTGCHNGCHDDPPPTRR